MEHKFTVLTDYAEFQRVKKELEHKKKEIDKRDETILTQQQIIENNRTCLDKTLKEKQEVNAKLNQLKSEMNTMETNFENIIRNYKKQLEQKQQEIDEIQIRSRPTDQDLLRLKIKNEVENVYKLDLEQKSQIIEELQDKYKEIDKRLQLKNEEMRLMHQAHEKELQRMRSDYQQKINENDLKFKAIKDTELLRERDVADKQRCLGELESMKKIVQMKEDECKRLRMQIDKDQLHHSKSVEQLTIDLMQDRNERQRLLSENEKLQEIIKSLERKIDLLLHRGSEDQQPPVQRLQSRQQDQIIKEMQQQINDLQKLVDDERSTRRKIEESLNNIIKQLKAEKQENQRYYETTIYDLKKSVKEEQAKNQQQQAKIKDQLQQINQLNNEIIENKEKMVFVQRENGILRENQNRINLNPSARFDTKVTDNIEQTIKELKDKIEKLESKNKKLRKKLEEANKKIMELLQKRISQQPSDENPVNSDQIQTKYQYFYQLKGDNVDYTKQPYQNQQQFQPQPPTFPIDVVSQQIRDDIYAQKQRLEDYKYKAATIYPARF